MHMPRLLAISTHVLAALLFLKPTAAFACSCVSFGSPCAEAGSASAIFVGTPLSVEKAPKGLRFHFRIEMPIQNIDGKTADVTTPPDEAACGYPFELGVKYLVYASGGRGVYGVSLCSRTGPLESRRDDIELLRQAAAGTVRPRLFGSVERLELLLDGAFMHHETRGGLPGIRILVTEGGRVREAHTDSNGRFVFDGITPGVYSLDARLPPSYSPLFEERIVARVDSCSGEVSIPVMTVPLRGTVRPAEGDTAVRQVMLRVAQVNADGSITLERSTLAFTEPDGSWQVPGLPAGRYVVGVSTLDAPTAQTPYPRRWYPKAAQPEAATVLTITDERSTSIEFQLPPRIPEVKISGTTVRPDGTPIPGVSVSLYDSAADVLPWALSFATSDAAGRFSITGLQGRRYRIEGKEVRRGWTSDLLEVTDEAMRSGVTITLKPRR